MHTSARNNRALGETVISPRAGCLRTFDVTNGLTGGARALLEDRTGGLWIATAIGLVRYDSDRFVVHDVRQGLRCAEVWALCLDIDGQIWLGTSQGISCFLSNRIVNYGTEDGLIHDRVTAICCAPTGALWIGTERGVSCFDGHAFTNYSEKEGLAHNTIHCCMADSRGRIWFGTAGGASCYHDGRFTNFTPSNGLPCSAIFDIVEAPDGQIWFASDGAGAIRVDEKTHSFLAIDTSAGLPSNRTRNLVFDAQGGMWCATWGAGLCRVLNDKVTTYTIDNGLLDNRVSSLYFDQQGLLWAAHLLSGLTCIDATGFVLECSLPVSETMIRDRQGRLWFGDEETLCCLDRGHLSMRRFPSRISGLLQDRDGRLWVASRFTGLYVFDESNDALIPDHKPSAHYSTESGLPSNCLLTVTEGPDGTIWAGTTTPGAVCRFDGSRFHAMSQAIPAVFRIHVDPENRVWFGGFSGGGLGCLDGEKLRVFKRKDGLPSESIQSLLTDTHGELWVGTQEGICRFDGLHFTTYAGEQGLYSIFHQCSAQTNDGLLYFGTLRGGVYVSDGVHFQWITSNDGLPSNSVTAIIPVEGGGIVIGTYRGILRYQRRTQRPRLEIQAVLGGETYTNPKQLQVTTAQARLLEIQLHVAANIRQRMRFSYFLEGHDTVWHDSWENEVRYDTLQVGRYTFHARAFTRDLVEAEAPPSFVIEIIPDPVETMRIEFEARIDEMGHRLDVQQRLSRQNRMLVEFARNRALEETELDSVFREIAEMAAQTLTCDRAGIWFLSPDRARLVCAALYERGARRHSSGTELVAMRWTHFLDVLERRRVITIENTATDDLCREVWPVYLSPQGISSMMAAAIRVAGKVTGFISLESVSPPRSWALDEEYFTASIVDFISLAIEMHERRRAENALAQSEERYRAFITRSTEGIWRCELERPLPIDLDDETQLRHLLRYCRLAECNDALARMYGLASAQEMMAACATSSGGPEGWWQRDIGRIRALVKSAYRLVEMETTQPNPAGTLQHMVSNVVGITRDGQLTQIWGTQRDVSRERLNEQERLKLEEQLRHSHKIEAIGRLAGGVAHDFNNLLTAILGCTDLLLEHSQNDDTALGYLTEIQAAAQRASSLTRQLLAFSRKQVLQPRVLDLNNVVEDMNRMLRRLIGENIELVTLTSPGLGQVKADPGQIEQVILNLAINARDAMPYGGRLVIQTQNVQIGPSSPPALSDLREGEYVLLSVADTGQGMDEHARSHVFEPFFTTKAAERGTGLGLSTVYGIVKQSDGAITFQSEIGQGTTFMVYLPVTHESAFAHTGESHTAAKSGGTETILLVEDERIVRELVMRILRMDGYSVLEAADPDEALVLCRNHAGRIHLTLSDVMMPKMTGYELAKELAVLRPDMRFLFMSGHTDEAARLNTDVSTSTPFIQKPFGIQALVRQVRSVLDAPESSAD